MSSPTTTVQSPQPKLKSQPVPKLDFVFIEQPTDTRNSDFRRQVRSHVTRAQHKKERSRKRDVREAIGASIGAIKPRGVLPRPNLTPPRAVSEQQTVVTSPRKINTTLSTGQQTARHADPTTCQRCPLRNESSVQRPSPVQTSKLSKTSPSPDRAALNKTLVNGVPSFTKTGSSTSALYGALINPNTRLGQSFSRGTMAFRTFALDDTTNIIGQSLDFLELDVAVVLSCYDFIVRIQAADLERRYANDPVVKAGTRYAKFRLQLSLDPVILNIAILITTRYLLGTRGGRIMRTKEVCQILHLRGVLIDYINTALSQPGRCVSDQMLIAVMIFAAHELYYAPIEGYHILMNGLVRMVNMRGGMSKLGRHDPYLERMLLWHDANASKQAGCEPYLSQVDEPSKLSRPQANADMFRMRGAYTPK